MDRADGSPGRSVANAISARHCTGTQPTTEHPSPPGPRPGLRALLRGTAAMRASSITVALQLLRFAANLGVSMLLARLLPPEDFGIFGMAMTAVGFLYLFRDGGVEAAMLHRANIAAPELAALASLNVLYGVGLGALCTALGPVLAWIYHEPQLTTATMLLSLCFVGYGLSVQPAATLLREQRFRAYAWVDFTALLLGLLTALVLALRGAGYWSLFAMELTVCFASLAGYWRVAQWRPRFSAAWRTVSGFVRFGRDVSVIRGLGFAAGNVDNILVGLTFGPAALAIYSKAFRLMNMPQEGVNWPLTRVAVPTLSRLRDNPAAFVAAFRRFNLISIAIAMPWAVFFFASAENVVRVVYGSQWLECVRLLQLLGVLGILNTFSLASAWVYVATGTVRRQVGWETLNFVVLAIAFGAGLRGGVPGVALAASVAGLALRVPALAFCFAGTPLRLRDVGAVLWRPALASLCAGAAILGVQALQRGSGTALGELALEAVAAGAGYALGWVVVPGWKRFLERELHSDTAA